MSKFYSQISKYYHYIFPTGDAQLNLIKEIAGKPPKNILDIACGSGGYSKVLSDIGHQVTGIDSNESMIEIAKEKDNNTQLHLMDMLNIDKLNSKYDLLFCIGNSMVHLDSEEEILDFLIKCKARLNQDGKLLLQIVNYDRILINDIKKLPTIENPEIDLIFERNYDYLPEEHKIEFNTILKVGGRSLENSQLLHPITSNELVDLLNEAGFKNIQLYGSFTKAEYDSMNSFPLVVIAEN